jgi:hypothetical protein
LPGREVLGSQVKEAAADQNAVADKQNQAGEQENGPWSQQEETAAQREDAASPQADAEYVARADDIQAAAVETFLDSHKISPYDALNADNIKKMAANQETLGDLSDQADNLDPPQKYKEQYEVFLRRSAFSASLKSLIRFSLSPRLTYQLERCSGPSERLVTTKRVFVPFSSTSAL